MIGAKRPLYLAFVIVFLGSALLLIPPTLHPVPDVRGANRTITLIGSTSGWNYSQPSGSNPTITATQGDTITMNLASGDGAPHRFLVDIDRDPMSPPDTSDCSGTDLCSSTFSTSAITTYTFTIDPTTPPGSYQYICTIHYPAMVGSFVVQSATTPSPDFSINNSPTSLSIAQGSTGTTTITLTSLNGFSGTLSLTGTVSPSGPSISFSPASVTLSSGGTATSTLTVSATGGLYSSVPNGNYSVSVVASNGTLPHSTTVQVTVGSSNSSPSGPANLPLTVLGGAAVVVIAAVAVTVFVLRRKSR